MRIILALLFAVAISQAAAQTSTTLTVPITITHAGSTILPPPPAGFQWVQTFGDEFNTTFGNSGTSSAPVTLDTSKWQIDHYCGNALYSGYSSPTYGCGGSTTASDTVSGGILTMTVQAGAPATRNIIDTAYTAYPPGTNQPITPFQQRYGFFVYDAKLPTCSSNQFDLEGFGGTGPSGSPYGELGWASQVNGGCHYGNLRPYQIDQNRNVSFFPDVNLGDITAAFHQYGLLWVNDGTAHGSATVYFDGIAESGPVALISPAFDSGMYFDVYWDPCSGCEGGTGTDPQGSTMQFDWIRAYKLCPAGVPSCQAFYVATNGNDTWSGSLPSPNAGNTDGPFATLTKCQSAMQASSIKTCLIRAGTYTPAAISNCWWGSGSPFDTCAVGFTSADNGETWESYPPDGCGSAIINGQSTSISTGLWVLFSGNNGPNNFTVNCLTMENFRFGAISFFSSGGSTSPNAVAVSNNFIKNGFYNDSLGPAGAGGVQCFNCTNMAITHNAITNMQGRGTSIQTFNQTGVTINNLTITSNYVAQTCLGEVDCGGIYQWDKPNQTSTGISINNNFVRDGNPNTTGTAIGGTGSGIYLDNCLSNANVSGNVITGQEGGSTLVSINGGSNNKFSGNIVDLEGFGRAIAQTVQVTATQSGFCGTATAGNSYTGNIIVGTGGGGSWSGTGTSGAGTAPTIQINDYFAYAGGAISSAGSGNNPTADSSPQNVNPQLTGCYAIAPGSPVLSAPINFPPIVGGWGPPGFTIPPATGGSVPSYPSPTC